ncbi:MAG: hypothetical protein GTN69_05285 [Armatimonadetes bacterium]|nr:hypothetical protein [Armatimonadota bacterium]NIO75296.1 hypothetical protein [Armatimonadota bacterium]NIO95856.1 hypothetical protein [Armatimonadota bacterium]
MRRLCLVVLVCAVLVSWVLAVAADAAEQRVRLHVLMHSFHCARESDWDRATNSDEPYLMVVGFKHPGA